MGYVKMSPDLFLGLAELNKLVNFLDQDGFRLLMRKITKNVGIVKASDDEDFDSFKVIVGDTPGCIKIAGDSYAIDADGNFIRYNSSTEIPLVDDSNWYEMSIGYIESTIEVGTVSISASGSLTGVGTKFTEVLRGQAKYQSRIKFPNSSINTASYAVVDVISDTSAILAGSFSEEVAIEYAVFGTFTAGEVIAADNQMPIRYDSCLITFESEGAPMSPTPGMGFLIARVKRNGGTVFIEDLRRDIWTISENRDTALVHLLDENFEYTPNPLIGVESVRWDNDHTVRDRNLVDIGWGMKSSNYTVDTKLRLVTVNGGSGGKFKSTEDFTDGDFDGWRVYTVQGTYNTILSSVLAGSQINLYLDRLIKAEFTGEIVIVPPVDEIHINIEDGTGSENTYVRENVKFSIADGFATIRVIVPATSVPLNIKYRYVSGAVYTDWMVLPSDTNSGYYTEVSFDYHGVLLADPDDRVKQTYTSHPTNGFITLTEHSMSYAHTIDRVFLGDLLGVRAGQSLVITSGVLTLTIGTDYQYQVIDLPTVLTKNTFIFLEDGNAVNGNKWYIQFKNTIDLNGFELKVVTDYVNPSTYELIYEITESQLLYVDDVSGLFLKLTRGAASWNITGYNEKLAGLSDKSWTRISGLGEVSVDELDNEPLEAACPFLYVYDTESNTYPFLSEVLRNVIGRENMITEETVVPRKYVNSDNILTFMIMEEKRECTCILGISIKDGEVYDIKKVISEYHNAIILYPDQGRVFKLNVGDSQGDPVLLIKGYYEKL